MKTNQFTINHIYPLCPKHLTEKFSLPRLSLFHINPARLRVCNDAAFQPGPSVGRIPLVG